MFYLGVDVAKAKLDCMLLDSSNGKLKSKSIANSSAGLSSCWNGWTSKKLTSRMS